MKRIIILVSVLITLTLQTNAQTPSDNKRDLKTGQAMEIFFNLFRATNAMYVDTTNPEGMVKTAIDAMLDELDPYTEYIPENKMDDFDFMTTGKYAGIGSLIRQRGAWTEIAEPYKNTPADRAGLKAGDKLLTIDGVSLKDIGSEKVSQMLKGEPNTTFTLTYAPIYDSTQTVSVKLTREKIAIPSVPYYGIISDSIGYIRFTGFTDHGADEVRLAFETLRTQAPLKGLILDVRGNGGGIVDGAIDIAGMFLPQGAEITSLKGRSTGSNQTYKSKIKPIDTQVPLVILINKISASASEILAGAIQDLDRGVIIGQRSFGKGLVQTTRPVSNNALLKVTIAKYYTPSGRCIQAVDYAHRNPDGAISPIPDSLATQFTTKNGRKVFDGGGINPDIKIDPLYWAKFTAILSAYGFIDDFANVYATKNKPLPIEQFKIDDKIYADFVKFMADKQISYRSSTELALDKLKEEANDEKYTERIKDLVEQIAVKIKDDKNTELELCKDEIKEALATAIIIRWYYNAGALEYAIKQNTDKEVRRAAELLNDPAEYNRILTEQDTSKN